MSCSTRSRSRAIISFRCSGVVVANIAAPIVDAIALGLGLVSTIVVDEAFGIIGLGDAPVVALGPSVDPKRPSAH